MSFRNARIGIHRLCILAAITLVSAVTAQAGLVNYYEFEGNYSGTVGAAAIPAQNPAQLSFVAGGFRGQSLDINDPAAFGGGNTGGSVNIPYNANPVQSPQVTFGAWFNLDTNSGFPGVMAIDNGGWDRGIHLNGNQWGIASGGTTNNIAAAPTGQWTYVVGTFNKPANRATLYVGNDVAATQTTSAGTRADGGNNPGEVQIEIGRYDNQDLDARVDDAFVWNTELTDHQVNAIRNLRLSSLDIAPTGADQLFNLFNAMSGSATVGGLNWTGTTGLSTTNPGELFDLGGGQFALVLDDSGSGLIGQAASSAIPEPSSLVAMGLGLLGVCWLRRRQLRSRAAASRSRV